MDDRIKYERAREAQLSKLVATYTTVKATDADKTTLSTTLQALVQALIDTPPEDYPAALATLKTDIADEVAAGFGTIEDYYAEIEGDITDPETCVQCGGDGFISSVADISLTEADRALSQNVICPLCDGDKYTNGAYRAIYGNPTGFELIP
jgi:hypothetical protein